MSWRFSMFFVVLLTSMVVPSVLQTFHRDGVYLRFLPADEMLSLRGGGGCIKDKPVDCPFVNALSCSGCTTGNTCTNVTGAAGQSTYVQCINSPSGLTECSLPTTIYCHVTWTCPTDCLQFQGQSRCDQTGPRQNHNPVQSDHSTGDSCSTAKLDLERAGFTVLAMTNTANLSSFLPLN